MSNNNRVIMKHDKAENWAKAKNFIPLAGEIIVYEYEDSPTPKIKIGDGKTPVNDLLFLNHFEVKNDSLKL